MASLAGIFDASDSLRLCKQPYTLKHIYIWSCIADLISHACWLPANCYHAIVLVTVQHYATALVTV